MKKLICYATIFGAMIVAFASCKKDNDEPVPGAFNGQIVAVVENGENWNDSIKRVRAAVYGVGIFVQTPLQTVASSPFTNGGFSLTLSPINPEHLMPLNFENFADFADFADFENFQISDTNVRGNGIVIEGFSSASGDFNDLDHKGNFIFGKSNFSITLVGISATVVQATYLYVDRSVTITGAQTESVTINDATVNTEMTMDLSLNQGWNIVYVTIEISRMAAITSKISISSKPVDDLKWYHETDFINPLSIFFQ